MTNSKSVLSMEYEQMRMRMWLIIRENTELEHKLGTQEMQVREKTCQ